MFRRDRVADSRIEVAAAIVRDDSGRVLLSKRPEHKHQGGRWEFPGGKLEPGESPAQALARELAEELDLQVSDCRPFMTIEHVYPELTVRLYFREVRYWQGVPRGLEGQPLDWFEPSVLSSLEFPEANRPVVSALLLPDFFAILPPEPSGDISVLLEKLPADSGVYLRGLEQTPERLLALAGYCREQGRTIMVRDDAGLAERAGAQVLHFGSARLRQGDLPAFRGMRSAAVHDEEEMALAVKAGLDMVFLSPVRGTPSHPGIRALGWEGFAAMAMGKPLAVYALGGVRPADLRQAREAGARGVAGIRAFFSTDLTPDA
jgi:8-oxo-dGTP diphosphatase